MNPLQEVSVLPANLNAYQPDIGYFKSDDVRIRDKTLRKRKVE